MVARCSQQTFVVRRHCYMARVAIPHRAMGKKATHGADDVVMHVPCADVVDPCEPGVSTYIASTPPRCPGETMPTADGTLPRDQWHESGCFAYDFERGRGSPPHGYPITAKTSL